MENSIPIVHKINELYKTIYSLKKTLNKIDRYGICLRAEELALFIFELSIETALAATKEKFNFLQKLRVKIEVLKKLIRLMLDLKIIPAKKYLELEHNLQEVSKMATGWQRYVHNKEPL